MSNVMVRQLFIILLLISCALVAPQLSGATEEYAKQTGQTCSVCHLDPTGGGELTPVGKTFAASRQTMTEKPATSLVVKGVRLAIGYIHFLIAIFWFGTILYVHLVLKPAYAASGLPRGELRVGVISMIVMGITGAILTYYRVTSLDTLLHTRFGILLVIKVALYLIMVLTALFVITVIGPRLKAKRKAPPPSATGNLTLEELASRDGKDGRPIWFAFEGKIYDVTQSRFWKQGIHMGRHPAGSDLTEALSQAPHDRDKVTAMTAVGELIAAPPGKTPLHERVFFAMAYLNLTIVLLIILILSLWRWG
jgi:predicted heme/steroid binding protein